MFVVIIKGKKKNYLSWHKSFRNHPVKWEKEIKK